MTATGDIDATFVSPGDFGRNCGALLQSQALRQFLAQIQRSTSHSAILGWTGVALCLLGFGLAINARRHLGRNWGTPMSRKEQPELVTSGPYALIRHPIYTGLILAMLGSAIGVNVFWPAHSIGVEAVADQASTDCLSRSSR